MAAAEALAREAEALEAHALELRRGELGYIILDTFARMPGWDPSLPLEGTSPNDALRNPKACGWAARLLAGTPAERRACELDARAKALREEAARC